MNQFCFSLVASLVPAISLADPLVTITCDTPKGSSMKYGVTIPERVQAEIEKKPTPKPRLKGPFADGYLEKPTFIIDSAKKKLTVNWSESEAELREKAKAKELGIPYCCSPYPATNAEIAIFSADQISALVVTIPYGVTVYSFFPKLGAAFITSQGFHPWTGEYADVMSFFSTCEFSWNGSH